jgi:hypothetical protein
MKKVFAILAFATLGAGLLAVSSCTKDDTTSPTISLTGGEILYLNLGTVFTEPGYVASDDKDGTITDNVMITGTVNTNEVGYYPITYMVSDAAGNETSVIREVYVKTAKLAGNYSVLDSITGSNTVNITYDVVVDSSAGTDWWKEIWIKNFGSFGSTLKVKATVAGSSMTIAEQTPSGFADPDYSGKISGTGTYNGAAKNVTFVSYKIVYDNTAHGTDNGKAHFTRQ